MNTMPSSTSPAGPLAGVTVLDLTRVLAGPWCTMLLADMGARVIKIERPGAGDDTRAWGPPFVAGESTYFLGVNRNKESVTLDVGRPEGRALLDRLLDRADVLVENFRPGTLARLGLDYASLAARRPSLVCCSISGFGRTGPRCDEPGYDATIQAESGLMSVTGEAQGPPVRVGSAVTDLAAGLLAAHGIVLALYARARTGRGQQVDVSLFESALALLGHHAPAYLLAGAMAGRLGNRHQSIAPYDTFPAADGEIVLAVGNDGQFRRLCDVLGVPELPGEEAFATNPARARNHGALRERLVPILRARPGAHWIEALRRADVPCGEVRDVAGAMADPQVRAREMIQTVAHASAGPLQVLGVPVKLSDTPGSVRTAPPTLGQHTDAVLGELGLDRRDVAALRGHGVI
jgi:formyl-CoA transferase/CoA:oxalate CoA-transferase